MTSPTAEDHFRHFVAHYLLSRRAHLPVWQEPMHDRTEIVSVKLDEMDRPVVTFRLHFLKSNLVESDLHPGKVAVGALMTILDWHTWLAHAADPKLWPQDRLASGSEIVAVGRQLGLTRSLGFSQYDDIPVGSTILLDCRVDADSAKSALIVAHFYDETGKVYARGQQDKVKLYQRLKMKAEKEKEEKEKEKQVKAQTSGKPKL